MLVHKSDGFFFIAGVKTDEDRDQVAEMQTKYGEDKVLLRGFYTQEIEVITNGKRRNVTPIVFEDVSEHNRKERRRMVKMSRMANSDLVGVPKSNAVDRTKHKRW